MIMVGRTRRRHKIFPPAMIGHPDVERACACKATPSNRS